MDETTKKHRLVLWLDELDFNTIQIELSLRQQRNLQPGFEGCQIPDGTTSNEDGIFLAEAIRDLNDYRSLWESEHKAK